MEEYDEQLKLPSGWTWATVRELALKVEYGSSAKTDEDASGVPVIRMGNIVNGRLMNSGLKYLPRTHKEFPKLLLEPCDVLFNRTNSAELVGKTAVYKGHPYPCSFASYLIRIRLADGYVPDLLSYYINSTFGRRWIASVVSQQVGQANVNGTKLQALSVPLPPFPEQQRIVAKIEELFTELDAGVESLKKAHEQLKRYRQAVLKAAVTGELTREWREAHRGELKPAADLLACILRERRAKWEADQLARIKTAGKMPKTDEWKKKYKPANGPDTSELPDLPEGWLWVSLGQLVWSVKDGPHYSPKYVEEGIPFITGGNVRPSGVDFVGAKHIEPELHEELCKRCKPEKGDVLYTKGGTTGIARVNTYDLEFSVWVHVAVLKLIDSVEPFYVQHALNSPDCYKQAQKFTHGVGNQDLGLTRMVNIVFAIPSPAEQKEAISEIERLMSIADATERTIEQSLKQAERLRQSILQQAFSGELVPQDPADEPAETLLARIKAERARNSHAPQRPRRATRRQKQLAQLNLLQ